MQFPGTIVFFAVTVLYVAYVPYEDIQRDVYTLKLQTDSGT